MFKIDYRQDECNGAFESMRAYDGVVFKLDEHMERLRESCKSLGLEIPIEKALRRRIMQEIKASLLKEAYVRIGVTPSGLNCTVKRPHSYAAKFYRSGVAIICVPTKKNFQNALNGKIKSQNFLNGIMAKAEGALAFEAILLTQDGYAAEGTVSNIFIIKEEALLTLPAYLGILDGITRRTVIGIARSLKLTVKEVPLTRHELYNADESFLTNTSIELMPVVNIDGRKIGAGVPGHITKRLMAEFRRIVIRGALAH